ncbi:MAG: sigma 54-interacting transcriptional regulator [Candidatus Latescibacter sp.]|nr:sigma 54-interacting transcriptional regulator [Candidatus Latescibacter sp.]
MTTGETKSEGFDAIRSKVLLTHAMKLANAPLVVEERLELLARIIGEYLSVDDVLIFLKEPETDTLVLRISIGLDPIAIGNVRISIGQGITGMVAKTRKYLTSKNILKDPRSFYSAYSEDEKYPSILSVPILWNDELLGVVNIRSKVEREFTEREAQELNNFTASIAGSIKHAQEYENLEYKAKLLELSNKIAGTVSSSLDLDVILDELAWEIANSFGINGVIIYLMDSKGTVTKTTSYGLKSTFVKNYPRETAASCFLTGEPKIRTIDTAKPFPDTSGRDQWNICLPLINRNKSLGVISLFGIDKENDDPKGLFLSIGVDVLLHIAGLSALAIENAVIHTEMKRLADENQKKLDVIDTMYARITAIFNSITNGIIAVDENGIIQDFNNLARKSLGLDDSARGSRNIDAITSYKPSLASIISQGNDLDNRVVTFITPASKFAAVVTTRSFRDASGEHRGSVISFRPMEDTVKLLSRFTSQRPRYTFEDIIGHSTSLAETVKLARLAAPTNSNVLIIGESGTGKELFSQAVHNASLVADGPFIPVNCAAIPKDLIESELFGYAEGAFTGARKGGYIGKFEQATGGTIFLDEIGDMPLDLQMKLLRVLQEKMIQRVGSEHIIPVSARVIAATNRDLKKAIQNGEFREELFWRLNVLTIQIPPLRDRKIDIPEFIQFFIEKFSKSSGKQIAGIDPGVLKKLMDYSWQGNIRELENALEHAVLIAQSKTISWDDIPSSLKDRMDEEVTGTTISDDLAEIHRTRDDSSRKLFREAILLAKGDVSLAAKKLGMSRATLYRRLKKADMTMSISTMRHSVNSEK